MKKLILLLVFIPLVFSCDKEGVNDPLIYSIEGKWLIEGMIPEGNCNSLYNSYEANDGNHIPNPLNYTYENDILTVDLNFGNKLVTPIVFKCDGGEVYFETPGYSLFRLNSDCQ
jgi:hypothetical protein